MQKLESVICKTSMRANFTYMLKFTSSITLYFTDNVNQSKTYSEISTIINQISENRNDGCQVFIYPEITEDISHCDYLG